MDDRLLVQVRTAKIAALELSRAIPTRAGSPYGALSTDDRAIQTIARMVFEALHAVEQAMLPDTRKTAKRQVTFAVDPVQLDVIARGDLGSLGMLLATVLRDNPDNADPLLDQQLATYGVSIVQ